MSTSDAAPGRTTRREPPTFRRVAVRHVEDLTPRMRRIVLGGPELDGFALDLPAASVRLLIPPAGEHELVMPTWAGNQFELPDGRRAPIRTFTPRHHDPDSHALTIDVVRHGTGAASAWVSGAAPGAEAAVSGPGRGYQIDARARSHLLMGDETALPAIAQLLEALDPAIPVAVHVELGAPEGRLALPDHPGARVTWHEPPDGAEPGATLVDAVRALAEVPDGVWVAGEAAAVQRIRTHLFDERGLTRSQATVRGYWKQGRSAT